MAETAQERAARKFQERLAQAQERAGGGGSNDAQKKAADEFQKRLKARTGDAGVDHAPSLGTQAKHAFGALPRGILSMIGSGAREAVNTVAQVAPFVPSLGAAGAVAKKMPGAGRLPGESSGDYYRRTHPLTAEMASSANRTAGRVTQGAASLAPGGLSPSNTAYAADVREGRILGSVLEDVSNVAGAVGGAGRVAGVVARTPAPLAVRAPAAALHQATGNLSRLSGDVMSMPARPVVAAVRGAGALAVRSGVGPAVGRLPVTTGMTERLVRSGKLAEEAIPDSGRATIGQAAAGTAQRIRENRLYRAEVLDPMTAEVLQGVRRIEKLTERANKLLPDTDAQHAVILARTGQAPEVEIARQLKGQARTDYVRDVWGIEHAPTDRTLEYVAGYVNDTLPGDLRSAMDRAYAPMRMAQQLHEERMLAGVGMDNPMNPEQLGDAPMESAIARVLQPQRARIAQAEAVLAGDPARGVPGLRAQVARQRAAVGTPDLAAAIPQQAIGRVERAARTAAEADVLRQAEARTAGAASRAAAAVDRSQPFPTPDPAVLADAERAARVAEEAAAAARSASGEARAARGAIESDERITPAERQAVQRVRAERRAEASRAMDDEQGNYDYLYGSGERLAAPPPRKRIGTDPITRRPIYSRGAGGEWDWWDQLSKAEQRRLIDNGWVRRQGGLAPDELADMAAAKGAAPGVIRSPGENVGYEGGTSEAMEAWVEHTRRIDEAAKVARTGRGDEGLTVADELAMIRERGVPHDYFDRDDYTAQAWADDYAETVETINTAAKGTPEREAALLHYRDIVPEGLHEAAAGKTFEEAFAIAADLAAERSARAVSPVGRLAASEEKVRAAVAESGDRPAVFGADERKLPPVTKFDTAETGKRFTFTAYHGSPSATADQLAAGFHAGQVRTGPADAHRLGDGVYLTDDAILASDFAHDLGVADTPGVVAVTKATLENPYVIRGDWRSVRDALDSLDPSALQAAGHDGIVVAGPIGSMREAVVFDPRKVSVTRVPGKPGAVAKGLTKPERALYNAVQAAIRGEVAETALSAARARAVDRIVAAAAPTLRSQGRAVGRAEGRAATLAGESAQAGAMAATREARLLGMDPQADLIAGMEVAQRRLAPQVARETRARTAEQRLATQERWAERLRQKEAAAEAWLREGNIDASGGRRDDAVPGRFATPLLTAATARRSVIRMADDLDEAAGVPGAGDHLRAMADTLPQTMRDLEAMGIEPDYLIGGAEERLGKGARLSGSTAATPSWRRVSSSRQKVEGRVPKTFKGTGRLYAEALQDAVKNQTTRVIEAEYGRTARQILTEQNLAPDVIDHLLSPAGWGQDLAKQMERFGYSEWNRAGRPRGMDATSPDTVFLPTALEKAYRQQFGNPWAHPAWKIIDVPTRTWKHLVLAMNPMWQIGNAVGAVMLSTAGGGLSVREMAKYGIEARRMLAREVETGVLELPARLHGAGQAGEMLRGFTDPAREWSVVPERIGGRTRPGGGRQVPEVVRHPIRASYRFNQFIDDWGRSTVYLAKKSKGLSDADAVRLSLRAMGDFSRMTPFEREIVRRALPFYAWSRHVTQLAGHLAIEHPVRVAWMMHLGANYGGGSDEAVVGTPSFLSGAIALKEGGIGDRLADRLLGDNGGVTRYVGMRSLNPYSDLASLPLVGEKELARGVGPVFKGVAFAGGLNLGKWRPVSGSPGSQGRSEYGGTEFRRSNLKALGYWLSQQSAPGRALYATTAEPHVRYDTGEPMKLKGAEIPLEGGRREAIIRNLGIPFVPTTFDEERHRARIEAVRRADERKRRNYAR